MTQSCTQDDAKMTHRDKNELRIQLCIE